MLVAALALAVAVSCSSPAATATPTQPAGPGSSPTPEASPAPGETATPAPSDSTPTPGGEPTPTASPEESPLPTEEPLEKPPRTDFQARLDWVGHRVAQMRGLPVVEDPDITFVDSERLKEILAEDFEDPEVLADMRSAERIFKMLGLIPVDSDLLELYRRLLETTVIGLYDPDTGQMYVLAEEGEPGELTPFAEYTYAHEYVHLLQDVHHGLGDLTEAVRDQGERSAALSALVEGDAVFTSTLFATSEMSPDEIMGLGEISPEELETLAGIPTFLRRLLEFPYTYGTDFVLALWLEGEMASVDAAWESPPETTEQILHPEKYMAGEGPIPVEPPDFATVLGEGWAVAERDVLGEFFLLAWIETLQPTSVMNVAAAAGWGGDAYVLLDGPDDGRAFAAVIEWDEPERDTAEFMEGMSVALDANNRFERIEGAGEDAPWLWQGPDGVLTLAANDAGRVTVTVAHDEAAARALADAALAGG